MQKNWGCLYFIPLHYTLYLPEPYDLNCRFQYDCMHSQIISKYIKTKKNNVGWTSLPSPKNFEFLSYIKTSVYQLSSANSLRH